MPVPDNLQLYTAFNADGTVELVTDPARTLSDLPQIPIPPDGVFSFEVESLEPGMYFIAVQKFVTGGLSSEQIDMVLHEKDGYNIVEISENVTLPFNIDMGEVTIQLP
jgi:hypothetical protein